MSELTPEQIAALPEEWQKMAHDTTRIRQALGLVYDPFHEIRLSDQEDLLAALADATLRAEQTALQPGQVAVDEADLRALVQMNDDWMQGHASCCKSCPLLGYSCTAEAQTDCRVALLQYFGLEPQ